MVGAVSDGVERSRRARPRDELERVGTQSVKGSFPSYVYCIYLPFEFLASYIFGLVWRIDVIRVRSNA